MTGYQIEQAAVNAAVSHQSFTSAPLAAQELLTPEAVFTPEPAEAVEAASIFAWADDRPLLGERFADWALAELEAMGPDGGAA